ncbi:FAD synthetase 2, chloroplastic isoform X2 [Ricinus communis]|uniref:FAD synthetase 2, chloroplastic isoform X2 n=2 Tax=Ricinus communis TaxID=3988 RepID=UPI00201A47A6|nr:FAD synthetase 2, chloroplastic isoform X2 [Ricinus communis]XP_048225949.1 FAD synthetase 2, chloroplastic isoform X2 [Ricinus communis]
MTFLCAKANKMMIMSFLLKDSPPLQLKSMRLEFKLLTNKYISAFQGGIVALGKFDALHIGHRELAIQASKVGTPYLLSFVGMAEVFGWEPRAPIVAKCDRNRVLASWAQYCDNITPLEFQIQFSSVRHLNPQQFVEKLSKELRVCGVVAGENYRFGYKAAGDASDLVRLCEEYGLGAYIINSVMDNKKDPINSNSRDSKDRGQVSSTRVRQALALGDMKYVSKLLGRRHRLMLMLKDQRGLTSSSSSRWRISAPKSCLLNLPPKDGFYKNCFLLFGNENRMTCSAIIDSMYIHLEMDELGLSIYNGSQDFQLLGVEFGD